MLSLKIVMSSKDFQAICNRMLKTRFRQDCSKSTQGQGVTPKRATQ
jgi:hypothetical protein